MAKPSAAQIARAEMEYSQIAGSPMRIDFVGADDTPITEGGTYGRIYAYGSELACLRLCRKMAHGSVRPAMEVDVWYWTADEPALSSAEVRERTQTALDWAIIAADVAKDAAKQRGDDDAHGRLYCIYATLVEMRNAAQ